MTGATGVDEATAGATATVPYRVRFDECGPDGAARTSMILRYAQDAAWIHSERLGFDRAWYAARGLTWLVRAASLEILRPVALGTTLAVSTTVVGYRKVWARRRTDGVLPDGAAAFRVLTDWVITDARGAPTRVPPEFPAVFAVPPGSFEPGRVPLPPSPPDAVMLRTDVRPEDLDPFGHVNNAAYIDYLEQALLAAPGAAGSVAALPRTIAVEYLQPAGLGTAILSATWALAPGATAGRAWAWRLTDATDRELARGRLSNEGSVTG